MKYFIVSATKVHAACNQQQQLLQTKSSIAYLRAVNFIQIRSSTFLAIVIIINASYLQFAYLIFPLFLFFIYTFLLLVAFYLIFSNKFTYYIHTIKYIFLLFGNISSSALKWSLRFVL